MTRAPELDSQLLETRDTLAKLVSSAFPVAPQSNFQKLLAVLSREPTFITLVTDDVLKSHSVDTATGIPLDLIADLLGITRGVDETDAEMYRTVLIEIIKRNSSGTIPELCKVVTTLTGLVNKYSVSLLGIDNKLPTSYKFEDYCSVKYNDGGYGITNYSEFIPLTSSGDEFKFLEQPALGTGYPDAAIRLIITGSVPYNLNIPTLMRILNEVRAAGVYIDPILEYSELGPKGIYCQTITTKEYIFHNYVEFVVTTSIEGMATTASTDKTVVQSLVTPTNEASVDLVQDITYGNCNWDSGFYGEDYTTITLITP